MWTCQPGSIYICRYCVVVLPVRFVQDMVFIHRSHPYHRCRGFIVCVCVGGGGGDLIGTLA